MRSIVISYCALTLLFSGGCVFMMVVGPDNVMEIFALPQVIITVAAISNAAFLLMALKNAPGRLLMAAGILYVLLQGRLLIASDFWDSLGVPALSLLFLLFFLKGTAVFLAGKENRQPK